MSLPTTLTLNVTRYYGNRLSGIGETVKMIKIKNEYQDNEGKLILKPFLLPNDTINTLNVLQKRSGFKLNQDIINKIIDYLLEWNLKLKVRLRHPTKVIPYPRRLYNPISRMVTTLAWRIVDVNGEGCSFSSHIISTELGMWGIAQ